ncbi:topoisomerase II [Stutzerimonas tarimensis]|uniref:Topoisomerase II n=1 Tax=Stutzerimonas tarimensis TaxID=1507735 RepID=A0ABV7T2L4_9GAMM
MADEMKVLLEKADGSLEEMSCQRLAVIWEGREVWLQPAADAQLVVGVEDEEDSAEYANLVVRPLAANLLSLALELEPADLVEEHVHGPDCGHAH